MSLNKKEPMMWHGMEYWKVWLGVGGLLTFVGLLFPPTRILLTGITGSILTPAMIGFLRQVGLWALFLLKHLVMAHLMLLKNFVVPRRHLFPSLEDDDPYTH